MAKKTPKCLIDDAIKMGKRNIYLLHDVQYIFKLQTKDVLKTLLTNKPNIGKMFETETIDVIYIKGYFNIINEKVTNVFYDKKNDTIKVMCKSGNEYSLFDFPIADIANVFENIMRWYNEENGVI